MFRSGMKYSALFLVLASVLVFSSCGTESTPTQTSSRVGPTTSGYYFDLTASPSIVPYEGSSTFTVLVVDSSGTAVADVSVLFSGSVDKAVEDTTGSNGIAQMLLDVKTRVGTETMTATVENKSVTVSYLVLAEI